MHHRRACLGKAQHHCLGYHLSAHDDVHGPQNRWQASGFVKARCQRSARLAGDAGRKALLLRGSLIFRRHNRRWESYVAYPLLVSLPMIPFSMSSQSRHVGYLLLCLH